MDKVKNWFHQVGESRTKNPFQELVELAASTKDEKLIHDAVNQYVNFYSPLSDEELLNQPISKECIVLMTLVPNTLNSLINSNTRKDLIQKIVVFLNSASIFIPKKSNFNKSFRVILYSMIGQESQSYLNQSERLLLNMTINTSFVEHILKEEHFNLILLTKPSNPILFKFLRSAILNSSISSLKSCLYMVNTIVSNINSSPPEIVFVIGAIYKKAVRVPDFETYFSKFNTFCLEISDYTFYIDAANSKTNDTDIIPAKFSDLIIESPETMMDQILKIIQKFPVYESTLFAVLNHVKNMELDLQERYLEIIGQTRQEIRNLLIAKTFPPWIFGFSCKLVINFVNKYMNSSMNQQYLTFLFNQVKSEELSKYFSDYDQFQDLLIAMLNNVSDYEDASFYFSKILSILLNGQERAIFTLDGFCRIFPIVTYLDLFLSSLDAINNLKSFEPMMSKLLIDTPEMRVSLMIKDFIQWAIDNQKLGIIAALSMDGPHEIIDKLIEKSDKLSNLSQKQLLKLTFAQLQNSEENSSATIRIPSLVPKLDSLTFNTLFDRYSAGKYLIDNNLISFDCKLLPEIGVQYISEKLAEMSIDFPEILVKLTNPDFPHTSVIQFQEGRESSYITVGQVPLTFYFRVDDYKNPINLFSAGGFDFKYENESLIVNDKPQTLPLNKWHKVSISFPDDCLSLSINDVRVIYTPMKSKKAVTIIGSTLNSPGSTFYLKSELELYETTSNPFGKKELVSYQPGSGILNIEYRGIYSFAPTINLVPKILEKLMDVQDNESFTLYIESLLNTSLLECVSLTMQHFLGLLRVILSQKIDILSFQIVKMCFDFCNIDGTMNWDNFKDLFLDYNIWTNGFRFVSSLIPFLKESKRGTRYPKEAALVLHFFFDLIMHCEVSDDDLEDLIIDMLKSNLSPQSSVVVYIISNENNRFVTKILENIPEILSSISIQFLPSLSFELQVKYIYEYAKICTRNDSIFSQKEIDNMMPILQNCIFETQFWVALFTLLTNRLCDTIEMYALAPIQRPDMLHSMIQFICKLFRSSEHEELLNMIVLTLCSMIMATQKLPLANFVKDIRNLLHFGVLTSKTNQLPIHFTTYENCRMPSEEIPAENQNLNKNENNLSDSCFKVPNSEEFLIFDELWFGLTPTPFIDACNNQINSLVNQNQNSEKVTDKSDTSIESNRVLESHLLQSIISIAVDLLKSVKGKQLTLVLNDLLIFGSDVDPNLSLMLHQSVLLKYMDELPVSYEVLKFINNFVILGWWEHNLTTLFNTVCMSFSRYTGFAENKDYNQRLTAFGNLVMSILSLQTDISSFKIQENLSVLFGKEILMNQSYHLFWLYFFINNILNVPNINNIWSNFMNNTSLIDNSKLLIYEGIFSQNESVFDKMQDISIMTARFTQNPPEFAEYLNKIKAKTSQNYTKFAIATNEKLQELNSKIVNLRNSYISESDNILNQKAEKLQENSKKVKESLLLIEKFQFQARFDLISHKKERSAFHLWWILPKLPNGKYQLCPTVHPLSIPMLFVPCSSKINFNNINDYFNYEKNKTFFKIGEYNVQNSNIPPTLSRFVSMPFFNNQNLTDFIFRSSFSHYKGIREFKTITIVYGTKRVTCALSFAEKGYYIITEAEGTQQGKLKLIENQSDIATTTFLDSISYKYYGSCSLFFGHCVLFMSDKHVVNCVKRNYCHEPVAVELWFSRGYSLFFVFDKQHDRDGFIENVGHREFFPISDSFFGPTYSTNVTKIVNDKKLMKKVTDDWVLGKISSLTYLGILNFLSDRSFSNFCQYPVMPWIINGRDLSKPIGTQDEQRFQSFQQTYDSSEPDYHYYGSHYSSAGVVMHFLLRVQPFTNLHIELHNGFDHRDRLFHDIDNEYLSCSSLSSHNVEELIPEFYVLPEFLVNVNNIPLKTTSSNISQDKVILPEKYKNDVDLVWSLRRMLDEVDNLEKWIDLIFGYNSRGENAKIQRNLFYPTTYGIKSQLIDDDAAFEQMKRCFGQTPTQLFTEQHPPRNTVNFKRTVLLADTDAVMMQKVNVKSDIELKDAIIIQYKDHLHVTSCTTYFSNLIHSSVLYYTDGLMNWKCNLNSFICSAFSFEKLLFCASLSRGSMIIFRCQCNKSGEITGYYTLSTTNPIPSQYLITTSSSQKSSSSINASSIENNSSSINASSIENTSSSINASSIENTSSSINTSSIENNSSSINTSTSQNSSSSINASSIENSSSSINASSIENNSSSINTSTSQNSSSSINASSIENSSSSINTSTSQNSSSSINASSIENNSSSINTSTSQNSSSSINASSIENNSSSINTSTSQNSSSSINASSIENSSSPIRNSDDENIDIIPLCCCISSHHYVTGEVIGKKLYTFHVGTGLMIRSIELKSSSKAVSVVIDDSFGCFIVFCEYSVEVWTLNGTFVGMKEFKSKCLCCCIACNDVDSTSASCHDDGFVRLWRSDASKSEMTMIKEIKVPFNDAVSMELIRGGSLLSVVSSSAVGVILAARGAGTGTISNKLPSECAKCGSKGKLSECQSCGLYYCSRCSMNNAGTICKDCLNKIEECADIDF